MVRFFKYSAKFCMLMFAVMLITGCGDKLDSPPENVPSANEVDYTIADDMILPLIGVYHQIYNNFPWQFHLLVSVRGDDVNDGCNGNAGIYIIDDFKYYDDTYNSASWSGVHNTWLYSYRTMIKMYQAIEEINKYRIYSGNLKSDQYIAEINTLRCWLLLHLTKTWGAILLPSGVDDIYFNKSKISDKEEVLQYISDELDETVIHLPDLNPNQRTDIPGAVTKYTALAIRAQALLELEKYQDVANVTSQIISSGKFELEPDFYELFKLNGKLNDENLFELQYSDFGSCETNNYSHQFAAYGPYRWTPKIDGAKGGWGYFEPSLKYIKFMLDRGETVRLETSVLFSNQGIEEIRDYADYSNLPSWISNTTRTGDRIEDNPLSFFCSGKHYLPSDQLSSGCYEYGTNKNFPIIRYAEILLMHAEALTRGADGPALLADQAVNMIRKRAKMPAITNVTSAEVMDEKLAELAMEWGIRFYDLVRLGKYEELNHEGKTFNHELTYLPYVDLMINVFPQLEDMQKLRREGLQSHKN